MKWRSRLQALLLALTMIVTFMPSLAFAEGGDAAADNDLSHYMIRVNDIKDGDWRVFTDVTTNISLNVDVVLMNNEDIIADADEYELKIIKETYTETDYYEDECVNGQINLDDNGTFSGRVFATAKNGSDLTGETEAIYVDIFHNKTLYPFGPDVSFDPDHMTNGPLPMTDYYLYSTSDSGVEPVVKIEGTVLTEDVDYTVRYRKEGADETVDSFPSEPGTYQCLISAIINNPGGYYGNNDSVWLIIAASEDYEQTKKDHDDAQNVINMINDIDFTDPDANKTKAASTAYDALSPAAKAIISEREYGRLQVAEFVLLMKNVDPANPTSDTVKAARAKYDSFCETAKTMFLGMACERQGDLVAKLESAEKKLEENTSPKDPISIQNAQVVLSKTAFIYNGAIQKPEIKTIDGKTLTEGTDFTASWSNGSSKNVGIYTVTITGKGDYTGTTKTTYKIGPKAITPSVTLSASSYTWNGKVRNPAVTVKDGTTKLAASDYTVTYASGRKNVGKYNVRVALKGNYSGAKTVSFKVDPKGTSLNPLKKAKKAATIKWKKQSARMSNARITGYQILLATDKQFTKNKKAVNVKGYSKVSKKVTGLKGGKKYYVKIRTYKTVGGATYYSPWSKVETVTTKK